ncbi:MAG: hypothetical protein ABIP67_17455, partial [Burkholderiales bacterium]
MENGDDSFRIGKEEREIIGRTAEQQLNAAKLLVKAIDDRPFYTHMLISLGANSPETEIQDIAPEASKLKILRALLVAYGVSIYQWPEIEKNWPYEVEGCLQYATPRRHIKSRLPGAEISLIYELTAILRLWSSEQPL